MADGTKELNFKLCFILINLNVNTHVWLVAAVSGSTDLEKGRDGETRVPWSYTAGQRGPVEINHKPRT